MTTLRRLQKRGAVDWRQIFPPSELSVSHPLLTAPIGRSLLLLAGPTTALMFAQIPLAVADGIFVGRLGTDALAGMALVVPFVTLMFNIANGGMGGGVASAVARALGAGRLDDARAIVLHTLLLASGFGVCFAVLDWSCSEGLFRLLGGAGAALEQALSYSHVLFSGAVTIWASAFLAALLRGSGDTVTPARVGLIASITYVPLSGVLTLGIADWPGFGVAGSAIASLCVTTGSALLLARAIRSGRLGFIANWDGVGLQWRIFREILRVGVLGSMTTLIGNLTAVLMIGLAGRFGTAALAGYGIGASRKHDRAGGLRHRLRSYDLGGRRRRCRCMATRGESGMGWRADRFRGGRLHRLVGRPVPRGVVAALHSRRSSRFGQRILHPSRRAVLLFVRPWSEPQFRKSRRRANGGTTDG